MRTSEFFLLSPDALLWETRMRDLASPFPPGMVRGLRTGTRTGSVANRKLLMTERFLRCRNCERGSDTDFFFSCGKRFCTIIFSDLPNLPIWQLKLLSALSRITEKNDGFPSCATFCKSFCRHSLRHSLYQTFGSYMTLAHCLLKVCLRDLCSLASKTCPAQCRQYHKRVKNQIWKD